MAVVVNDNTKCQIDRTNKSPPTSVSSPPPLDLGMEVREVEPVEIEVCEVEPVEVVEPAIVEPATLKSPKQVLYVKRKMPKRKRKSGRGATRGGDQKSSRLNIVYQHAVPVPRNDDGNGSIDSVHVKWMNKKLHRGNSVRAHPYAHPQHINVIKHFVYICGMDSKWVWSLNHDITTSLRLCNTPIFVNSTPDLHRHNSVRADPYAHPQHIKVLKHFLYI